MKNSKQILYIVLGILVTIAWSSCGKKKHRSQTEQVVVDTTFLHPTLDTLKEVNSLPLPPSIEEAPKFEYKLRLTKTGLEPFNKELKLDQVNHVFITSSDTFPTTKEYVINEQSTSFKYIFAGKQNKCTIFKDRVETEVATYLKDSLSDYAPLRKRFVTCTEFYKSVASGATWKSVSNYYLIPEKRLRELNPNKATPGNKFVFKKVCQ